MTRQTAVQVVPLTFSSGVTVNAYLILDKNPTRMNQKLKTVTRYLQQHPSGWKKRLELANLLYAMGNLEQAIEEYRQVIERQPQLVNVRLQLAHLLQLIGHKAEAITVYNHALSQASNPATQQHIQGLIAVCQGDTQAGIVAFESATSLEPDNGAHWLALAQVQMGRADAIAALPAFERVLALNPDDIIALIGSYDTLMAVGQIREAQQRLNKVLELAPGDIRVLQRQVDTRCRMRLVSGEEGKQTKQMIRAVVRLAPDAADAQELLASYRLFRKEWAKGVGVLEAFTQQHPNNPRGWYNYGRCLFHTGDYQKAAEVMLKAYYLYPQACEIYQALCEILSVLSPSTPLDPPQPPFKRGESEEAAPLTSSGEPEEVKPSNCTKETHLKVPLFKGDLGGSNRQVTLAWIIEEMLERFPERWSVWATAGRVLVECFPDIERGCAVSLKGTQLQPQLPDAWFRHGRVLALAGKHQEAVEALARGWQLLPETGGDLSPVSGLVWRAESYHALGDEVASRRWWEKACQLGMELIEFDPAMAYYWQGRALEGLGDVKGAMQAYRSALSQSLLYPLRGEAETAMKRLKGRGGKGSRS